MMADGSADYVKKLGLENDPHGPRQACARSASHCWSTTAWVKAVNVEAPGKFGSERRRHHAQGVEVHSFACGRCNLAGRSRQSRQMRNRSGCKLGEMQPDRYDIQRPSLILLWTSDLLSRLNGNAHYIGQPSNRALPSSIFRTTLFSALPGVGSLLSWPLVRSDSRFLIRLGADIPENDLRGDVPADSFGRP